MSSIEGIGVLDLLGAVFGTVWKRGYLYAPGPGFLDCFYSGLKGEYLLLPLGRRRLRPS